MKSLNEKVNLKTQQNAQLFIVHDVSVEKHDFRSFQSNRQYV